MIDPYDFGFKIPREALLEEVAWEKLHLLLEVTV